MSIKKFIDKHKGETCYILGDGPSIKSFDLPSFSNHIGIACGNLIFHNDFKKLNVKYYAIPEPWLFYPRILQKKSYLKNYYKISSFLKSEIKKSNDIQFFINLSNFGFIKSKNIHFIHRFLIKNIKNFEIYDGIDPFSGSFYTSLSLAYIMGFKKIYIVGHDAWTAKYRSSNRWYENGEGSTVTIKNPKKDILIDLLSSEMKMISILHGKETMNVESLDYESFSGKKVSYKENFELCDVKKLKVLDTFPDYKIFN